MDWLEYLLHVCNNLPPVPRIDLPGKVCLHSQHPVHSHSKDPRRMKSKPNIHFVPWHCLQHWQLGSLDVEREEVDGWVAQGKQDGVQGQALHCQIVKISDLRLITCILILSSPSSAVDSGTRPAIAFRPSPWSFTVPESLKIELHRYSLIFKGLW